jgi:protein-glutamine gamma-glutamyltransferase
VRPLQARYRKSPARDFSRCPRTSIPASAHWPRDSSQIENYTYQFGIQIPSGKDALTYFLLEHPPAHCEYFATGAAILLRLGGVPCRYVTGFVAAERNDIGGYWIARNRDAHAWVEVYDDADGTWRTVEPTVAAGVPGAEPSTPGAAIAHVIDSIRYVVGRVYAAIESGRWRDTLVAAMAHAFRWVASPAGLAVVVAAIAIAILKRRRTAIRSARTSRINPEMDALIRLRTEVDKAVKKSGISRRLEETVLAFADRLEATCAANDAEANKERLRRAVAWYREYNELRFSGHVTRERIEELRAHRTLIQPRKARKHTKEKA